MSVDEKQVAARLAAFVDGLRKSGFRLTHQRLEVARELAGSDTHPDVETIYASVRRRVPTISLDTVYRTVGTLADLGLLSRMSTTTGPARYDANTEVHPHFYCSTCGRMTDVHGLGPAGFDAVASITNASADGVGAIDFVEVRFVGTCAECRSDRKPDRKATIKRGKEHQAR